MNVALRVFNLLMGLCVGSVTFAQSLELNTFKMDKPANSVLILPYQLPNSEGLLTHVPQKGRLTVLNFWATFCGPCRQEMPSLNRLWDKYKDRGLDVQAVALDGDRKTAIEKFIKRFDLTLPILLDDDSGISKDYQVSVMPITYLISPEGEVIGRAVGEREWDSPEAFELIEQLLALDQQAVF